MTVDLDNIERVATAFQTAGTWNAVIRGIRSLNLFVEELQHLENCSPDVVLALVARIRELEKRCAWLTGERESLLSCVPED